MGKHKRKRNPIVVKKSSVFQKGPLPYQEMESDTPSGQNKPQKPQLSREEEWNSLREMLHKCIYGISEQKLQALKDSGDSSFLSRFLVFADNIIIPFAYFFFAFWVKSIYENIDYSWSSFLSLDGWTKATWIISFILIFPFFWRPVGTRTPFSYLKNLLRVKFWLWFFIISAFLSIALLYIYAAARVGYVRGGLGLLEVPYMQYCLYLVSLSLVCVFRSDTTLISPIGIDDYDREKKESIGFGERLCRLKEKMKYHWKKTFIMEDGNGLAEDFSFLVAIKSFFLIVDNLIVALLYSLFFLWVNNYWGEDASGCDLACSLFKTVEEMNTQFDSVSFYFLCFLCAFWRPIRKTKKLPLSRYFSGLFWVVLLLPVVFALLISGLESIYSDNAVEPLPFVVRFLRQAVFGIFVCYRHLFLPYLVEE